MIDLPIQAATVMETSYHNFDILIERFGEKYRAQVIDSPVGTASTEFDLPLSDLQLENYILRMGQTRQGKRLPFASTELKAVQQCGESLFEAVFAGDVYTCYLMSWELARGEGKGLRIRLLIDVPEFHDYPWELLYNSKLNQFIALSNDTPIVRFFELPFPELPLYVKAPLKILVLISSPEGFPSLNVEEEWKKLESAFAPLIERGLVVLERLKRPTLGELQKALRRDQFHIFHFIGHGKFVVHKQDGVLLMEDELNGRGRPVSGQYLSILLHDHQSLRMVVLNACEGPRTSQSDPYAGVAQTLVQQGIPAVIAMQFPIFEDYAIKFAFEFYGAVVDGFPIDTAVSEARKAIFTTGNETEWATPVLFMNSPDGKIFDFSQPTPERAESITQPVDVEESVSEQNAPSDVKERTHLSSFWKRSAWVLIILAVLIGLGLWIGDPILALSPTPTSELHVTSAVVGHQTALTLTLTPVPTNTPRPTVTSPPTVAPYPQAIKDNKNIDMVLIPAGDFEMGSEEGYIDERPVHNVYLDAYYIDKYEITNEAYEMCVQLKICRRPIDYSSYQRLSYFGDPEYYDYPVINVTLEMARSFCEDWRGASLPTEAQWEKAARGQRVQHSRGVRGSVVSMQIIGIKNATACAIPSRLQVSKWGKACMVYTTCQGMFGNG